MQQASAAMSRSKIYPTLEEYRKNNSDEVLREEATRLRTRNPGRIPVLVFTRANDNLVMQRQKFLIPGTLPVMQVKQVIRQYLENSKLKSDQALYYFVQNTLLDSSSLLSQVEQTCGTIAGFVVILLSLESTFGEDSIKFN